MNVKIWFFIGLGLMVLAFIVLAISNLPGCQSISECWEYLGYAPDHWSELPLVSKILVIGSILSFAGCIILLIKGGIK